MATTLAVSPTFTLVGAYSKTGTLPGDSIVDTINYDNTTTNYVTGSGNNQANVIWKSTRIAGAGETFDLDAASMTDEFGTALTFTKIRLLFLRNRSTTTGEYISVGGDFLSQASVGACAAGAGVRIGPGGSYLLESPIDGWTVTATTGDGITITAGAGTPSYDIILMGIV